MISKNKKWVVALSVVTMIAANGIVMAAVNGENQGAAIEKAAVSEKGIKHKRLHKAGNTELLTLLKIDAETFKKEMQAGKSLLTIAGERGVSEATLKELVIKQMSQRIDAGVKAGRLTIEQGVKMKVDIENRAVKMINREGKTLLKNQRQHPNASNSALLKLLNIERDTLRSELKSGKTLVVIAKERGVSEQTLKDTLMAQMEQRVEQRVKAGKLSAEKAQELKAKQEQRIDDMINGKRLLHKR